MKRHIMLLVMAFDNESHEIFKLTCEPGEVLVGDFEAIKTVLPNRAVNCYTVSKTKDKCYLVCLWHRTKDVKIKFRQDE